MYRERVCRVHIYSLYRRRYIHVREHNEVRRRVWVYIYIYKGIYITRCVAESGFISVAFTSVAKRHSEMRRQVWVNIVSKAKRHSYREMNCFTLTPYTVHSTPYTVHSTQYTVHRTPYTVHSTHQLAHSTQYTVHRTPYTVHRTQYTVHRNCTLH